MSVAASVSIATVLPKWDNVVHVDNTTPAKHNDKHRGSDLHSATLSSCANTDHNSVDPNFMPLPTLAGGDSTKEETATATASSLKQQSSPDSDRRERSSVGNLLFAVKSDIVPAGSQ